MRRGRKLGEVPCAFAGAQNCANTCRRRKRRRESPQDALCWQRRSRGAHESRGHAGDQERNQPMANNSNFAIHSEAPALHSLFPEADRFLLQGLPISNTHQSNPSLPRRAGSANACKSLCLACGALSSSHSLSPSFRAARTFSHLFLH